MAGQHKSLSDPAFARVYGPVQLVDVRVLISARAGETVERAKRACEHALVARSHAVQVRLEGQELRARADQTLSERQLIRHRAGGTAGEAGSGQHSADSTVASLESVAPV